MDNKFPVDAGFECDKCSMTVGVIRGKIKILPVKMYSLIWREI
jgi:hypothetical protein